MIFLFFSSRRRHTRLTCDWSSDVCLPISAMSNMQRAVVRVVEGESTLPGECTPLGICDVELPAFLPKGSPVELTYEYNPNQVLEVSVEASGNRAKVSIERNTGLAPSEVAQAAANLGSLRVA